MAKTEIMNCVECGFDYDIYPYEKLLGSICSHCGKFQKEFTFYET